MNTPSRRATEHWRSLSAGLVLAVVLAAASLSGQQRAQVPVFRAEANVIPLDVIVIDGEGRPVTGLAAADFEVTVDGRPRKILNAQFLSSASADGSAAAAPPKRSWDIEDAYRAAYVGNERVESGEPNASRSLVIAIDQSSFGTAAGRNAAVAARGLLDLLHPSDRVGLAVFPPPGVNVAPTRDRARVRQALDRVMGTAEPFPRLEVALTVNDALGWESGSRSGVLERTCSGSGGGQGAGTNLPTGPESCVQSVEEGASQLLQYAQRQTRITLQGLSDVINTSALTGAPTTILLVSGGMFGGGSVTNQLGVDQEVRNLARLTSLSQARLYALYVESGFLDRDSMDRARVSGFSTADGDLRLDGLRELASRSGGTLTRVTSGSGEGFRRVSLELSAYYLLGLESDPSDRDGQRHRVRVRVNRPGLTVRTREDIYLPVARKLTADAAVKEALRAPQFERDLPIRLSTQVMREEDHEKVRVVISAHIDRGVTSPRPIHVGYSVRGVGAVGTQASSEIQTRTLPIVGTGEDATLSYVETISLTPGRYRLRLAASADGERVGSIEQPVDAMLLGNQALAFSDLLLVDPGRKVKEGFAPIADGRVTTAALEAFIEIYPQPGQKIGSVTFDISDTPGGQPIAGGSVTPDSRGAQRLSAGVSLDLAALPSGTYMLNARILDGETLLGRASRPFRIDRPAGLGGAEPRAAFAFAASGGVVRNFAREDALRPDAVNYFLGRLRAADEAGAGRPAVQNAAQALGQSQFDAVMQSLAAEGDDLLSVTFLKGLALLGQGQLEPAAEAFRSALRISNDFLPAAFYLGACYAAGGRDREAAGAWQTSLVSESDSRIVYEVLADAWLRLEDPKRAEAIIKEAQERWPGDDVFAPRLAAAKVLLKQRGEAFGVLQPYIEKHPSEAEPLFLAIRLLYEAHDAGKPIKSKAEDKELATKYAALYQQANGVSQPLVARWVGAMGK